MYHRVNTTQDQDVVAYDVKNNALTKHMISLADKDEYAILYKHSHENS